MKKYTSVLCDGKPTGEIFVKSFISVTEENCDICRAINSFIKEFDEGKLPENFNKSIRNLATGNLKSHLKSKKHWKYIGSKYIMSKR